MRQKHFILSVVFLGILQSCNPDTAPTPHSYSSIESSKEYGAFVAEYIPFPSSLTIEGIDFKISQAWAEHPHRWAGNDLIISKLTYDYVITFESKEKNEIDLHRYTKDLTGGNSKVWYFLPDKDFKRDTLIIEYKDRLNGQDKKKLNLVKKLSN